MLCRVEGKYRLRNYVVRNHGEYRQRTYNYIGSRSRSYHLHVSIHTS